MTGHAYPDRYPPGSHWSTDVAWEILDTLPVDALDSVQRAYICGLIAGALMQVATKGPIMTHQALMRFKDAPHSL